MKDTRKSAKGFTDEERGAMKERARELKADARRGPRAAKADGALTELTAANETRIAALVKKAVS